MHSLFSEKGIRAFASKAAAAAMATAIFFPLACSSSSSPTADGSSSDGGGSVDGGSADDGSSDDGGSDTNPCRAMGNAGGVVHSTADSMHPLPVATGGAIADGVYVATAATQYEENSAGQSVYISCGGELNDFQETIRFEGGAIEDVSNNVGDAPQIAGGTFTTSGTKIAVHLTCPSTYDYSDGYSVTGSKVLLIGPTSNDSNGTCGPIVEELTPQ